MTSQTTLRKHAAMVDQMATNQGIDLQEAALRGRISLDDISGAVLSCTNCTNPDECSRWLAITEALTETPPDYCRNQSLFQDLAEG